MSYRQINEVKEGAAPAFFLGSGTGGFWTDSGGGRCPPGLAFGEYSESLGGADLPHHTPQGLFYCLSNAGQRKG